MMWLLLLLLLLPVQVLADSGVTFTGSSVNATVASSNPADQTYPTSATTGPYSTGTTLRGQCATLCTGGLDASGSITTDSDDQTIECKAVAGAIRVHHERTLIRCVTITVNDSLCAGGTSFAGVLIDENFVTGHDTVIEDATITSVDDTDSKGIRSIQRYYEVYRTEISKFEDGVADKMMSVYDSYIHDLNGCSVDPHIDNVQMTGGAGGGVAHFEGNYLHNPASQTSNFIIEHDHDPAIDKLTFIGNRFGPANPTMRHAIIGKGDKGTCPGEAQGVIFQDNWFDWVDGADISIDCCPTAGWTWTNNVDDAGDAIAQPACN